MITIICGNDSVASRQFLSGVSREAVKLEAGQLAPEQIAQALGPASLFGSQTNVIINHLPSDKILKQLAGHSQPDIYLWHHKNLTPGQTKKFKELGFSFKIFRLPRIIFQFLSSLSLKDFHECLKTEPVELVFYLLHRKISSQISKNPQPKWFKLHQELQQIDREIKSGQTQVDLITRLDLCLSSI